MTLKAKSRCSLVKKTRTKNPELIALIRVLTKKRRETKADIWKAVVKRLNKSRNRRIVVNVSRLNRHTLKNELVVVPGKVLGAGEIDHSITVAALAFSQKAKEKIIAVKGVCLSFSELIKKNPTGSNVRVIG